MASANPARTAAYDGTNPALCDQVRQAHI